MKGLFRLLVALLLLPASLPVMAQNPLELLDLPSCTPEQDSIDIARVRARIDSIKQHRPVVAVVLAGGGARGLGGFWNSSTGWGASLSFGLNF